MRIGLFTDTYHPALNGIVTVVDILREQLEAEGHEAFVFCPKVYSVKVSKNKTLKNDPWVVYFPAIESGFFEDYGLTAFFPPLALRKIKKLNLDVIIFFTPRQVGLMGVYAAKKLKIPLVAQHSTDLYEYIDHYPMVIPGMVALNALMPYHVKMNGQDAKSWLKSFKPGRKWGKKTIEHMVIMLYRRCDVVVVLSRKSYGQISSWKGSSRVNLTMIPTGVNPLPEASDSDIKDFRNQLGVRSDETVVLYAGRLSAEKNLEILIESMAAVVREYPKAKLVFVGDFEYRKHLEELAAASLAKNNIIFAGRLPRDKMGVAYGAADIFAFPSLKDTQGLVLHEAALAGLPIVMIDEPVTEVVKHGQNGLIADNSADSLALALVEIIGNTQLHAKMSAKSRELALKFSEEIQTKKLISILELLKKDRNLPASSKRRKLRGFIKKFRLTNN